MRHESDMYIPLYYPSHASTPDTVVVLCSLAFQKSYYPTLPVLTEYNGVLRCDTIATF